MMIFRILPYETKEMVLQNVCFNAVGVALLIAQGCQTIVQATLGCVWFAWNNAVGVALFKRNPP